ncbi:MAG: hypothetical protein ACO25B_07760 [Chitinophagaceae bacterium]
MNAIRKIFMILPLGLGFCMQSAAQITESFDLATFRPGKGWKKETRNDFVSYTKTNSANGGYCVIAIYKNIASLGSTERDFENEWKTLVTNRFTVNGKPQYNSGIRPDGWSSKAGAAAIHDGKGDAIALLSVFTFGGRAISMLTLMNRDEYLSESENFLGSLTLKQPPAGTPNPTSGGNAGTQKSSGSGISISTTNFNDGWTSTIHKDWVMVRKGSTKVYLYYYFPVGDEWRPPNGNISDNLWNRIIRQRFNIISENEGRRSMVNEWKEGEAIDKESGERVYLAMSWNGGFYLAVTPDRQTSYREFPSPDDLNNMTRYNKFAVSLKDMVGNWQSGGSQTTQWYNDVTGFYTGATLASSSAVFAFASNGTYSSVHNGASGAVVGGMNTFQQKYNGKYSVSNWQVTANNRYQGKTDNFDAHFQAVRGGRLLYLNNGRGENYLMVKTK